MEETLKNRTKKFVVMCHFEKRPKIRMKLILILIFVPFVLFGQKRTNFSKLIEETNYYLNNYSKLSPYGEYYAISDFGLSKQEIKGLIEDADYDDMLTKNKDSIGSFHMISFIAEKIERKIDQIV